MAREGDPDGTGETTIFGLETAGAIAERPELADALVEIARLELEIAA